MIPRKILKKIYQIEPRMDRLTSEVSFQPAPKSGRIASAVKYGSHADELGFNVEIHTVFPEDLNFCFTNRTANETEAIGVFKDMMECRVDFSLKSISQSRL